MEERFSREAMLLGEAAVEKLKNAHVAVFGIGGVGSYVVEALARCGVGHFLLVDGDVVAESNINRQLIADETTIGIEKVCVARERILRINSEAEVETKSCFYLPENAEEISLSGFSYVVDAVDMVSAKLEIIQRAKQVGVPVISCMGAGNKLDPTKFQVADIEKTSVCPLARVMRTKLRKMGIRGVKTVFSTEEVKTPHTCEEGRIKTPGSVAFVPSVAGLILAGEVVKDLIAQEG